MTTNTILPAATPRSCLGTPSVLPSARVSTWNLGATGHARSAGRPAPVAVFTTVDPAARGMRRDRIAAKQDRPPRGIPR